MTTVRGRDVREDDHETHRDGTRLAEVFAARR